mgnify:CR=1 FL=1
MPDDRNVIITRLRGLLVQLASDFGTDASNVAEHDVIPDAGILDSAGVIEFVMLIDDAYDLALEAEDMTIDNLGSLSAIAAFIASRQAARL